MMALDPVDGIIATGGDDLEALTKALSGERAELLTLYLGADVDQAAGERMGPQRAVRLAALKWSLHVVSSQLNGYS